VHPGELPYPYKKYVSVPRTITSAYTICDDLVHGFGGGYLPPILRTRHTSAIPPQTFTFRENMTVVIQPNIITADEHMGIQVGELVQVTHDGVESLHRYPYDVYPVWRVAPLAFTEAVSTCHAERSEASQPIQ
jgi:hypothetical protein